MPTAILNMGEGSVHQEAERAFCGVIVGQRLTKASEKKRIWRLKQVVKPGLAENRRFKGQAGRR
jgi:hypothetical protein